MISFSKNDILDLNKDKSFILERTLINGTKKIREFSARFINALASDYSGRSYLLEADKLVLMLVTTLKLEVITTIIIERIITISQEIPLCGRIAWEHYKNYH